MSDTTCIKKKQWAPQIREQLKALVSTADLICYRGSFICQLIKYVPFFPLKSSLNRILCLRMSRQNWTIGHVNVHRLKGGFSRFLRFPRGVHSISWNWKWLSQQCTIFCRNPCMHRIYCSLQHICTCTDTCTHMSALFSTREQRN